MYVKAGKFQISMIRLLENEQEARLVSIADDKQKKVVVPLNLVCDAIEIADDEWKQYLDIEKMEVVSLLESPFAGEYDEDEQELADLIEEGGRTRFFGLPTKFDIHEYSIMEQFIWSLPEGRMQDSLEGAIRGNGAFRRFKDAIYKFEIEQKWFDFQASKYREIAIEWCENHGFEYSDDKTRNEDETITDVEDLDDRKNLTWEEISTEHIVQDQWIDFRRSAYRFPDGSVYEPFYSYSRRDYVVIVASDAAGKYLCVRQFRQGIKEVTTEFPAGGIERTDGREYGVGRGSSTSENALEAAKRELLEETGYVSKDWTHLLTVPANATISDNYVYIFMAENCCKSGGQNLDETEFLNIRKYSADQIGEMIDKGNFQQAVHIMAWLLMQKRTMEVL